jgi:hypothetical protein
MNGDGKDSPAVLELSCRLDTSNQQNMAEACLGIRTSADRFQTRQADYEEATAERDARRQEGRCKRERKGRRRIKTSSGTSLERTKRLSCLRKISSAWGEEKIQHYQWLFAGEKYCAVLGTALSQVPNWAEASIKLNQLILRRIQMRQRRPLKFSINLIDLIDLENLKRWRDQNPYIKMNDRERVTLYYRRLTLNDIPDTYGFDKYGLVVRAEFVSIRTTTLFSKDEDANVCPSVEDDVVAPIRKRQRPVESSQPGSKRARTAVCRERSDEEQIEDLAGVLRSLDKDFAEKKRLSQEHKWCEPVPHTRKVSTVQEFYKAFHDRRTLPIYTCMICYRKCAKAELEEIDWDR